MTTSEAMSLPDVAGPLEEEEPKKSRRGKQYKCGVCGEKGHNQKTCTRRGGEQEDDMLMPLSRLQPCKLEAALEAANKRVIAADKQVAGSTTDQDFEEATAALDAAVRQLEKVASCAHRCAMVAHTLGGWERREREVKRLRVGDEDGEEKDSEVE